VPAAEDLPDLAGFFFPICFTYDYDYDPGRKKALL